jgi:hypothetical protein
MFETTDRIPVEKVPYEPPVVVDYGNVTLITRAATGGRHDGGLGDDGADDLAGTA